ncbi:MAG: c-type cytochrome [Burkholderiaceae bacterium]|nr:c-type cytochrome [Burkholderiaceae bacterium]
MALAFVGGLTLLAGAPAAPAEKPVFRHPFDGQPIEVPEAKTKTPALERFKQTGKNAYRDDPSAVGQGKALYEQWCQVCHNSDGSGKMCPALIGSEHIYPQTSTDPGMFAILYAGASGAMQSFANRISQDDMLRVIAYVRTLGK